ncbi:hypothetical protein P7K49_015681 [Saguinus oedipus]|uniref:Uncharacterized protein n=1 Tax=Saguinus oedipus TaxID=9490 RepID=A0ABQ9VAC7_SAGOE|nr:hypothetical protein P7K49_015681 [Saguinus oedipus]
MDGDMEMRMLMAQVPHSQLYTEVSPDRKQDTGPGGSSQAGRGHLRKVESFCQLQHLRKITQNGAKARAPYPLSPAPSEARRCFQGWGRAGAGTRGTSRTRPLRGPGDSVVPCGVTPPTSALTGRARRNRRHSAQDFCPPVVPVMAVTRVTRFLGGVEGRGRGGPSALKGPATRAREAVPLESAPGAGT